MISGMLHFPFKVILGYQEDDRNTKTAKQDTALWLLWYQGTESVISRDLRLGLMLTFFDFIDPFWHVLILKLSIFRPK